MISFGGRFPLYFSLLASFLAVGRWLFPHSQTSPTYFVRLCPHHPPFVVPRPRHISLLPASWPVCCTLA